jgi:2-hydroxychromene-2-carboxylate isomerase
MAGQYAGAESVLYFHQADDPYSHLAVQMLARLEQTYDLPFKACLVPPPLDSAAPDRERLSKWSLTDAHRLARAHGLSMPQSAIRPSEARISMAQEALAAALEQPDFARIAEAIGEALWSADDAGLATFPRSPALPGMEAAAELRQQLGHYLGAVFHYDGQWHWGPDRLHYLEAQLAGQRRPGTEPVARLLQESDRTDVHSPVTLDFFLSFRSPYTYLAARRARALASRYGATFRLRPVLPMVMRGLPVPREKQVYIVRDCWREAMRMGIAFGRSVDPVGLGVERGMGVLARAMSLGKGEDFAESFLAGAFSEAIDATTDEGLMAMASRAGLSEADVKAGLADDAWRAVAEANRQELLSMDLWGVPSFRVGDLPGHWGQDRLWAVEQDLIAAADRT